MSISLFFLFQIFISHPPVFSRDRKPAKELFNYGIRRVPGDFALAGFMALPALLTAHLVSDNLSTAGDVAFSVSLVNMAGAAFGPICLLLLPKASTAFAQNNTGGLLKEVKIITWFTALSSLVGILIVQIFAEELLTLYLGSYPSSLPEIVRWVVPGILGFGVYVSLRSVLDAYYIKAVNTSNIILTSVVFLFISGATFFMKLDFMYILYGFLFSVFLLGFLTLRQTFQLLTGKGTT
jgi:O-antigen/teichoic acid export membrane protein